MAAIDDSLPARISPNCPDDTREVLHHAWAHDRDGLKALLRTRGKASAQDPTTGETPLHAAIRACGPATPSSDEDEEDGCVEEAREVVQDLFLSGAIWNDVDGNNETPGCVALRLGRKTLYNLCVDAGVRAELLFAIMGDYEALSSGDEEDDDEEMEQDPVEETIAAENGAENDVAVEPKFIPPDAKEKAVTNEEYLSSKLTYDNDKLVDSDLNGVMMAWETDIMRRSVAALIPDSAPGKRILNIGFGMGIIDGMLADLKPSRHHIIEAHPSVLEHLAQPGSKFGSEWEKSGSEEGAFKVHKGKWQDIVPQLLADGEIYDAIYFDTFGEDYSQLRMFFTEYVIGIMDEGGRFSFFNGLGADRKICYDVYTKVVEMQGADAGLDVEWEESDVDMARLDQAGKGDWEGVRRRYWTLDSEIPSSTLFDDKYLTLVSQNTGCRFAPSWARTR
ncbi:Protein arginine N-methyltransferase 2 [Neonectria ditissima]|uniref:Arginine N-methyltransferase 2 n=1 Tax=Neonectria ditissima TaxID=78410 RepID=A0A0P7B622_9HYPO|nr:Protein arginine N-methyltransferase 2 [Neonectria ditissima]